MSQLLYLYDQHGGDKQRFVYYCSGCRCVLSVRRSIWSPKEPPNGRCLGCGVPLEGNVECSFASIPKEWPDAQASQAAAQVLQKPEFRQASSFPHFSLAFQPLDSILRPMSPGDLVVLSGAPSTAVAELAAFRAQAPVESGGLDSGVVFVDGGNRSDPYLFSSIARQSMVKPAAAMRRVATCRVFTFYQLADLIAGHLARAASDYGAKLIVVSDILGTFNEPELEEREARRVLSAVESGLNEAKKEAVVIVTLASQSKYDDIVNSWADTSVCLSEARDGIRAEMQRHRGRPPAESTFKLKQLLMLKARPTR